MVRTKSTSVTYRIWFSNGEHESFADATSDKGGQNAGFRPHDLLEAALASCITMTAQMFAQRNGIALREVRATVRLNRDDPNTTAFEIETAFDGELTRDEIERLHAAIRVCPVRKTLSKEIRFLESGF